ncbi:ATP-grasp domain-containing protein [Streptomyces sp. Je 1-4]|uniref:ATP-grasp domain-containing protein n=1 Tax=Streptomyces TaxID=1883 RepID=UPI00140EBA70|nr:MULTISPECIES: ATP-grasp domain-containing protein [unclassified Streptomyces]QIK09054.1 ATP-grasp domain-containing protein [Streptomyces sp. ID38640]UYB42749.1 ATP-grasp domain-containing protein [Streptomyces sp. Je 1-4]UZQ39079.1 ATP-grasp domain-containing protein [Streptomyces sp. Je 1-4] [Streptomyces sp. Je 1-4 4N24]UZQ46496.1 ATP-grasp domain-containing protein [Streptomyces sp. Je 1-4] [Streptomyces sp. Je 1-4 4N24_ara]
MILTVSLKDDLHALAVQHEAWRRGYRDFHILECDQLSGRQSLSWHSHEDAPTTVLTSDGTEVNVEEAPLIWWRRVRASQKASEHIDDEFERNLINNDCRGALTGLLCAAFQGEWISHPEATDRASDKLYQLAVAKQAGFRVPRTLVTQSRDEVAAFLQQVGRVIVKPVVGATGPLMFTQRIEDPTSFQAESFAACPAIYQEYIEGSEHIRLNCFGDRMYAALLKTDQLDWRADLTIPISEWRVPEETAKKVTSVLQRLGLRMGAIDIKLTPSGEPVWLEVNPQGQFLFLEPLLNIPLGELFLDFLLSEAGDHTAPTTLV